MLSTTSIGRGELLIQEGELAGRSYRFEAMVCENPTCDCEHLTLKCFTETPEAGTPTPVPVYLEMDLDRQKIANLADLEVNPAKLALAKAVAAESGPEEWKQLRRMYWGLKQYWTEHADLEEVEVVFPPGAATGAMVAYFDVSRLPRGLSLVMSRRIGWRTTNTAAIRNARARKPFSCSFAFPRKWVRRPSGRRCRSLTNIETAKSLGSSR